MKALIYDIEIAKAICGRNEQRIEGVDYCEGWHDHAGMGIASIAAFDYIEDRYRVFMADNFGEFAALVKERSPIVSFNGISFDNRVCAANEIDLPNENTYDILVQLWRAADLGSTFNFKTHGGFGLDAVCQANFGVGKTGSGALAPVQFQRKQYGALLDYNLTDVHRTKLLFDRILATGELVDPRNRNRMLRIMAPASIQPAFA